VRELRNVIERMVVLGTGEKLTVRDLPAALRAGAGKTGPAAQAGHVLRDAERHLIEAALQRHKGHRTRAAQDLGISRRTLHRKLNEFGLRNSKDD
jgi:DNA-binding NtrC family response regulator